MELTELPQNQIDAIRYFSDAKVCHDFLESMRWPHGITCRHCGSMKIGKLIETIVPSRSKRPDAKPYVRRFWNCNNCYGQFTVKTGTIFEDSAIGLEKWLPAIWMICNAKNGVSSCELSRVLGIGQKAAWFMGHRIRMAMQQPSAKHIKTEAEQEGEK